MLFSDTELINCTLATSNNYLKKFLNSKDSFSSAYYKRIYEILFDSWSNQVDVAYQKRFCNSKSI